MQGGINRSAMKKTQTSKKMNVQTNANVAKGGLLNNQPHSPQAGIRILNDTPENKQKTTVAVIVTFTNGSTYDPLFTQEEQKSLEGTKVEVYACNSFYLQSLFEAIVNGDPKDEVAKKLVESMKLVEPDCVVFNWECSSGYSGQTFTENKDLLFSFLRKMMDRGHMCMYSDFSLKALVNEWDEKYELGPNPFVKAGEFSNLFEVRFNCGQLKECPSAQLQIIGEMAEKGLCNIQAAGGTIVYCVDSDKIKHDIYKTEVLTVVTNIKPPKPSYVSTIGQHSGSAGHVLLRYPSGGMILTSMGHWVEIMKIDTSEKKLFEVAEREFGAIEATKMRAEYMNMGMQEQQSYVASKAREFVKNQAPCSNMNRKSRNS